MSKKNSKKGLCVEIEKSGAVSALNVSPETSEEQGTTTETNASEEIPEVLKVEKKPKPTLIPIRIKAMVILGLKESDIMSEKDRDGIYVFATNDGKRLEYDYRPKERIVPDGLRIACDGLGISVDDVLYDEKRHCYGWNAYVDKVVVTTIAGKKLTHEV